MKDEDSVIEHMNAFNTMVYQLLYIDINISYEDKFISLSCSVSNSWDSMVFTIGSNETTLKVYQIVSSILD